jgi:hypothetical protein
MKLNAGMHLACCATVRRDESWAEAFESLNQHALRLRGRVAPNKPWAIDLRLGGRAARELNDHPNLLELQRWLGKNHCYVVGLDGSAFGHFPAGRVKERVYEPDWTSPDRLAYTNLLFDLLAQLLPPGMDGNVRTLPGSFKGFYLHNDELKVIRNHLWQCVAHAARVSEQTGRAMHLGLEPEPMCVLESSGEVIQFFERLRTEHPRDPRLTEYLGVDYDSCHFAVEFEEPQDALGCLHQHGIRINAIRLSSALTLHPTPEALEAIAPLAQDPYLHQVVVCRPDGERFIYADLRDALSGEASTPAETGPIDPSPTSEALSASSEWRVHFHLPLHSPPSPPFGNTCDHALGVLDILSEEPGLCRQLELDADTWTVLPAELRARDGMDQIEAEYAWTLAQLAERGLMPA